MGLTVENPVKTIYRPRLGKFGDNEPGNRPPGRNALTLRDDAPSAGSTAIWVGIAAIVMMFAALTSALVVREGASTDWHRFALPTILYFNTLALVCSSITMEMFLRRFRGHSFARWSLAGPSGWLYATFGLGSIFVVGQCLAWHQLSDEGVYMASNPSHSFFYVLTGAHALHLLGGLVALIYITIKFRRFTLQSNTADVARKYWHFMDLLWLYVLGVLWVKL